MARALSAPCGHRILAPAPCPSSSDSARSARCRARSRRRHRSARPARCRDASRQVPAGSLVASAPKSHKVGLADSTRTAPDALPSRPGSTARSPALPATPEEFEPAAPRRALLLEPGPPSRLADNLHGQGSGRTVDEGQRHGHAHKSVVQGSRLPAKVLAGKLCSGGCMADFTLVIGNKNYSSWSLRGWLMARIAGIEFEEMVVPLDLPETQPAIRKHSPSGRVPVLLHRGARGVGVAGDRRVSQRPEARGRPVAGRRGGARPCPLDLRPRCMRASSTCAPTCR